MNATALPGISVGAFERARIDPESFDHEAHVYMAWLYLDQYPVPEALEKFDAALRRLTVKLGVPGKYHATITWFFLLLICERRNADPGADWHRFRQRNADLFKGGIIERYYNRRTLASDRARQAFILPDRLIDQGKWKGTDSSTSA
jgi:hypothetical protein